MIISDNKLKGIITACLLLAIIPFSSLLSGSFVKYKIPVLATQCDDCPAIETVERGQPSGIYFVAPGTRINEFLTSAGIEQKPADNFIMRNGTRLIFEPSSAGENIVVAQMPQATRLSLGLPIDINKATQEDLLLIKGIGNATAEKIIVLRDRVKRFRDINQLMEIKGIKEKRMSEIRKYLYVEKH